MRAQRLLALLITTAFASGAVLAGVVPHLLYGKRIAGQVVDAETGQPIAGAHVAFFWESSVIPKTSTAHISPDICYHAAAALTDASGYFEIPAWEKWSTYDVRTANASGAIYSPRYRPYFISVDQRRAAPAASLNEHYELKPFSGTNAERMEMLFWGLGNRDCLYGGESQKSLYPMLKAIYQEAKKTAQTRADEQTVRSLARLAAEAALAQDPTKPWDDEKTKMFVEENLK